MIREKLEMDCDVASNGLQGLKQYQQRIKLYRNYLEHHYHKVYSVVNKKKLKIEASDNNSQFENDNDEENYKPYKLIITDCNMPVMDGLEMSTKILETWDEFSTKYMNKRYSHIRVMKSQEPNFEALK